jgi:hypothetical protein
MSKSGGQGVTVRRAGVAIRKLVCYFPRLVAGQAGVWETMEGHWEWISLAERHPRGRMWWM